MLRRMRAAALPDPIVRRHAELDLTRQDSVDRFFREERPHLVLVAAAKVGGIAANDALPADFAFQNLMIAANVIHAAFACKAKRLLFLGSSCVYPRNVRQPMREADLLSGPLEPTNRSYAVAKIAGIELCRAYRRQHGAEFFAAMPSNLYGPGDNYDPLGSHVIPGLIRKMYEAKVSGAPEVEVWGTGRPLREFLYSDDLADACLTLLGLPDNKFAALFPGHDEVPLVNVGSGEEVSIRDLAGMIAEAVGFNGRLRFDDSMPDGTPRKLMDSSRLLELGWRPRVKLQDGLRLAYQDFQEKIQAAPATV